MNREVFRAYDVRGVVEKQLDHEFAQLLGRAIGTWVIRKGGRKLLVGRDIRPSGIWLQRALTDGLLVSGIEVTDIGITPTPVGYWAIGKLGMDGAVQITGSHNPPEYNGFKITAMGGSLHGDAIQELADLIENNDFEEGHGTLAKQEVIHRYIEDLSSILKPTTSPFKVVLDGGNGTAGLTAPLLYKALGYEVEELYCDPDGEFPNHHPDPTVEENLEDLKKKVVETRADLGISFDGDADRLGVVTPEGRVIWGDYLLAFFARDILKDQPGATIIGEVKCSKSVYDDIKENGGNAIMWKAGHSLIKAKMKEENALLAGEMSGHIFFAHRYYGFDDAVYAGARLMEILSSAPRPLSEMARELDTMVATPEIRMDCAEEYKFELVRRMTDRFRVKEIVDGDIEVIDIDGVRVEWSDGWGLVRPSNTQPILVLRFEAKDEARMNEIRSIFEREIEDIRKELIG